jgi:anti-sigma B factor antagonist
VPITDGQIQDGLLTVRRADEGAHIRLSLRGELDLSNVPTLERTLDAAIDSGKKVLIDLERLEFLDSTGLALIVHMLGRTDAERFSFVPSRHRAVSRLLTLTGLDERMAIDTAADEALSSLPTA